MKHKEMSLDELWEREREEKEKQQKRDWDTMCKLIDEIETYGIWRERDENYPKKITFEFEYPNGKHGDIDMYLTQKYGVVEKVTPTSYRTTISTKYKDEIELLVAFYYTRFSMNALHVNRKNNDQALSFLHKYYNIIILSDISLRVENTMDYEDRLKNPIINKEYHIVRDAQMRMKETRNKLYSEIIAKGKASPRWKSEQQVYRIVKELYNDAIFQYHSEWLGRQSLDIYIPSLRLGIEYQGIQHYQEIEFFNKYDSLESRKSRDKQKKQLCKENDIRLIEWRYYENITTERLKEKLKEFGYI